MANKVLVTVRVEPGSLGPDGKDHIESFCQLAQCYFDKHQSELLNYHVIARYDKTLPEIDYSYTDKHLNETQANKMLSVIGKDIDQMDTEVMEHIANLIDKYLGHQY